MNLVRCIYLPACDGLGDAMPRAIITLNLGFNACTLNDNQVPEMVELFNQLGVYDSAMTQLSILMDPDEFSLMFQSSGSYIVTDQLLSDWQWELLQQTKIPWVSLNVDPAENAENPSLDSI